MKKREDCKNQLQIAPLPSTIHHTYKLEAKGNQEKNKIYFARLRGYRDRH